MNIYIDESGSFVHDIVTGKWNVVAALATAESARKGLSAAMAALRVDVAAMSGAEVKINQVPEAAYLAFLERLAPLDLALFFVATDAGLNSIANIRAHQDVQASKILTHIDKMKYEEGKESLRTLAAEVRGLPPQLYVQLICQIQLMLEVVERSILYFVQRRPATLGSFRWRIDRKGEVKNDYERAFEKLSPALLQTMSFRRPLATVEGFDYSYMQRYKFAAGDEPAYLKTVYGIEVGSCFNIGKLIREDLQFVDSRSLDGVQAVDLLASGIRKCLRGAFGNTPKIADHLGRLTVQASREKLPFRLVRLGGESNLDEATSAIIRVLARGRRNMMPR